MAQCDICKKNFKAGYQKVCCVCQAHLCENCSYSSRFYRKYKGNGLPDKESDETAYFCEIHFMEFVKGFIPKVIEDTGGDLYVIRGRYMENNKKVEYFREFRGKNLIEIINKTIEFWPSDEWKDWNTM